MAVSDTRRFFRRSAEHWQHDEYFAVKRQIHHRQYVRQYLPHVNIVEYGWQPVAVVNHR